MSEYMEDLERELRRVNNEREYLIEQKKKLEAKDSPSFSQEIEEIRGRLRQNHDLIESLQKKIMEIRTEENKKTERRTPSH